MLISKAISPAMPVLLLGYLAIEVLPLAFAIYDARPIAHLQARREMKIAMA